VQAAELTGRAGHEPRYAESFCVHPIATYKEGAESVPNKALKFELKELSVEGEFTGLASVYGVEDLGGDVVMAGAFTRTLSDSGRDRPLLWQHNAPIGMCQLADTGSALALTGKLSMGLQAAQDAYILLKDGVVRGLSIGFQTVREEFVGNIRQLKELKLWEVSLVTFPMLPAAQVTSFKNAQQTADISRALKQFRGDVIDALEGRR
jgi:uncharacterized protein